MAENIQQPAIVDVLAEDGIATTAFYTWMEQVTQALLPPLTGTGSPEGVVVATSGKWYIDTSAGSGSGIFFKETGEGNTGWVARS